MSMVSELHGGMGARIDDADIGRAFEAGELLVTRRHGDLKVRSRALGDLPLEQARQAIGQWIETHPAMTEQQEAMAAGIFAPDRLEVDPGAADDRYAAWDELLSQAAQSRWSNTLVLRQALLDAAREQGVALAEADQKDMDARLEHTLATVTVALEEIIPWDARRSGQACLRLGGHPGGLWARWDGAQRGHDGDVDLGALLADRFALIGRFGPATLGLLCSVTERALLQGDIVLPGLPSRPLIRGRRRRLEP